MVYLLTSLDILDNLCETAAADNSLLNSKLSLLINKNFCISRDSHAMKEDMFIPRMRA